jgi:parallel beta-helix repeat protein
MIPPQGIGGIGAVNIAGGKRSNTVIVAAYNSIDKSRADYVCDGIDDQETINFAISAISSTGGTVLLLEGTYNINSTGTKTVEYDGYQMELKYGIYITSNVILVGQGSSTMLVIDTNFNIGDAYAGTVIFSDNTRGIEISHIAINGNQYIFDFPVGAIFMYNVSDSRISCCNVQYAVYGVNLLGSNCTIADNVCDESYIDITGNNNTVSGNVCNEGIYGIAVSGSENNIYNNRCYNTHDHNVVVVGDSNTISGNMCISGYYGIVVSGSKNQIYNNRCYNAFSHGVYISRFFVQGITTSNNHVYGNICYGCDSGILIEGSDYNSVIGNICYMNYGNGIGIIGSNNIVSDNIVLGNSQSSDNYHDGICIVSLVNVQSSYNIVSNNVIRHMGLVNQQRYGIYIDSGCIGNLVINNDLYQAGKTLDFYDEGTDTIYHNNRTTQGWVT